MKLAFYKSPQLLNGQTWSQVFGETWTSVTFAAGWSNNTDKTAVAELYVTLDGGNSWELINPSAFYYGTPQMEVFNNLVAGPVNGVKIFVLQAAQGNSLAVEVTGI